MSLRHEIPTHLNVEDKAFFGLSVRQFMYLVTGLAGAYGGWMQFPTWPVAIRVLLVVLNVIGAVAMAIIRPGGRGLDEWALVFLRSRLVPRVAIWKPRRPSVAAWRLLGNAWREITPRLSWKEGKK